MLNQKDNTLVLLILGSPSLLEYDSKNQIKATKYINYSFTAYAILIKRLSLQLGIKENHICTIALGKEKDYDITSLIDDNYIYVQLTTDEIYKTKCKKSELNFKYFSNVTELIYYIISFSEKSGCISPNIILFMYDHSDDNIFSKMKFVDIYIGLKIIKHSSLYIFNDNCKSNCMIMKINNYLHISQAIASHPGITSSDDLIFLTFVSLKLCSEENPDRLINQLLSQWEKIYSLNDRYYEFQSNDDDESFNYLYYLSQNQVIQVNNALYQKFSEEEGNLLAQIISWYYSIYNISPGSYEVIYQKLKKSEGIGIIKDALLNLKCTIAELYTILIDLKKEKIDFISRKNTLMPNLFIISSSDKNGLSPTFETIRLNENKKIILGSPAMGAYIISVLMIQSEYPKAVKIIEDYVYGKNTNLIQEYPIELPVLGQNKKIWNQLHIYHWESNSFLGNEIDFNVDTNNVQVNLEDIMNSINFNLSEKFEKIFNNQNYCITKKMQPLFKSKKINVIGFRLVPRKENHHLSILNLDYDTYYDSNSSAYEDYDALHESNIPNSSFKDEIGYNELISSSYFNEIKQEIQNLDKMCFSQRVFEVFKHHLEKIKHSQEFMNKYQYSKQKVSKKIPMFFESMIVDWIDYFLPSFLLQYFSDELVLLFYKFMHSYNIDEDASKEIFYKCMNVADQVSSQLSYINKKTAYDPDRFNKNI